MSADIMVGFRAVALHREKRQADDVRAPAVPRGTAIIVTRYRDDVEKVALVNPADLAMLEEAHDILWAVEQAPAEPLSRTALKALRLEDRSREGARVEDAKRIAAMLDL
jgi:hypothetical protein